MKDELKINQKESEDSFLFRHKTNLNFILVLSINKQTNNKKLKFNS